MVPTIGRIVIYKLTAQDAEQINRRRTTGESIRERMKPKMDLSIFGLGVNINADQLWAQGAQAHIGNPAEAGQEFPMLITRVLKQERDVGNITWLVASGQVFLDGNDVLWVQARTEGLEPGEWRWPGRVT